MRKRNLLMTLVVMALTLSFASQVLAQVPIEGWDKAKFGMSSEEIKSAYAEEAYFGPDTFWEERQEDIVSGYPYTLSTFELIAFGDKRRASFYFVDNRLFGIELTITRIVVDTKKDSPKKLVELGTGMFDEYGKIKSFLITKYGDSFVEEGDKSWTWYIWTDGKDNSAILASSVKFEDVVGSPFSYVTTLLTRAMYANDELEKLRQSKIEEEGN